MADFVEDWSITDTLGEGAYGEVKLVTNKTTGDCVAMKLIDLVKGGPGVRAAVEKEVKIHKFLRDPHIIRCYGSRQQSNNFYIFLEYAPNGELFDRIEPDIGMPVDQAQKFMNQLIAGVAYLHRSGIAHRDIKPENLLLDKDDNLKISDFGLATIFRLQGKERALEKRCGTLPYVAPEVLTRPYAAAPADIWSCGIVLIAMLAGELPWDKPSPDCPEFLAWSTKGDYVRSLPWSKLDTTGLSLVKSMLHESPSCRPTALQVAAHRFLHTAKPSRIPSSKRRKPSETLSQVVQPTKPSEPDLKPLSSFSQPTDYIDDILLSTQQILSTQTTVQNCLQKLVRRMTRFYLSLEATTALSQLSSVLDKLALPWLQASSTIVEVSLIDRRKSPLIFKATLFPVNLPSGEEEDEDENSSSPARRKKSCCLVDFRLSKGDGLEFKRHFLSIQSAIRSHITPAPYFGSSNSAAANHAVRRLS